MCLIVVYVFVSINLYTKQLPTPEMPSKLIGFLESMLYKLHLFSLAMFVKHMLTLCGSSFPSSGYMVQRGLIYRCLQTNLPSLLAQKIAAWEIQKFPGSVPADNYS